MNDTHELEILKALREVTAQVSSLEATTRIMQEEVQSLTRTIHKGNGHPALVQRVARIEEQQSDTKKIKFAAFSAALAAAGSLASRFL